VISPRAAWAAIYPKASSLFTRKLYPRPDALKQKIAGQPFGGDCNATLGIAATVKPAACD
jgi:hypothetical protein